MQTSAHDSPNPQADADAGRQNSRPSDLVYPAVTLLAMLLLLGSLWAF